METASKYDFWKKSIAFQEKKGQKVWFLWLSLPLTVSLFFSTNVLSISVVTNKETALAYFVYCLQEIESILRSGNLDENRLDNAHFLRFQRLRGHSRSGQKFYVLS